ncbi:unnamed protein product [Mytilus edulis]|uniref:Uncharacterized protein n=1 Tax=Mytilus edulis TaxID=6550 RepID=A0A8S3VCB7_MYTED|nr:unnamed protein product [Mytilus edulis]
MNLLSKKYKRRVQHKFVYQQAKQKNKRQVQQSEVAQPKEAEPEVAKQPWVETQTEEPEELQLQIGNNSRLTAKGIQHRVTTDLESLLPHTDILSIPNEAFIPNKTDHDNLFSDFQILIQRALVTFIPELKDFRDLVTFHIGHQYSKASEKKSDIDLDVMKIHALLEEEPRGSYKVNYIVTEGGRIIELQYDNKFTINLGEFKLLKKYRVYDEKMSLPSHALCFESAPFPLNSFEEAIGLFKNPPVVAINSITNLQDHHQRISIRGEITRNDTEFQETAEGLVIGASFVRDELSIYIEDFGMVTTSFEQMSNIFATNAFEEGIILRCAVNNGELTYIVYPQHNAQIQASIQMTDSSTQTDHIIIPQELLGSNTSSQLTTVEEDEMSDSDDPEWVPSDEEEEIEGVIDINEQKNEAKEKKFIVFETELHDLFRECAKCRKTLTSEEIVKKKSDWNFYSDQYNL